MSLWPSLALLTLGLGTALVFLVATAVQNRRAHRAREADLAAWAKRMCPPAVRESEIGWLEFPAAVVCGACGRPDQLVATGYGIFCAPCVQSGRDLRAFLDPHHRPEHHDTH